MKRSLLEKFDSKSLFFLSRRVRLRVFLDLFVSEAGYEVVVDHSDGLHEGIANGGSNEFEATFLEFFAHGTRFICLRWHV